MLHQTTLANKPVRRSVPHTNRWIRKKPKQPCLPITSLNEFVTCGIPMKTGPLNSGPVIFSLSNILDLVLAARSLHVQYSTRYLFLCSINTLLWFEPELSAACWSRSQAATINHDLHYSGAKRMQRELLDGSGGVGVLGVIVDCSI